MKKRHKTLIMAGIVCAMLALAYPAWTVYYDIYGTNALLKGDLVVQRDLSVSRYATFSGPVNMPATVITGTLADPTDTLTALSTNMVYIDKLAGVTTYTVNIPQITEAMDGKEFWFKQIDSATTPATITPAAGYDAIESTQGTFTATSDATIDAAGDIKAWKAYYIGAPSGVSNLWILISEDRA